jgi:CheY-like chemotaxis protein
MGETILIVEDEATVKEVIRFMLETLNYKTIMASNGEEALKLYDEHHDKIALVLTDMVMPGMGGIELAKLLFKKNPSLKIIAISGYPLDNDIDDLKEKGIVGLLSKPLQIKTLSEALAKALSK